MSRANEKIVDVLIEGGIEYVFGVPGGSTIPIWSRLYGKEDKIKAILARHEQSASCMADAYGRLTGKPAVLMGQGPFIASSGGFGIMESYIFGSPMVVITDTSDSGLSQHGNYQSGTGEYGSVDVFGMLKTMSKFITYAVTPEEAVHGVQLAIKHSMSGRPGPACVVIRSTAVTGEINPEAALKIRPTAGFLQESPTLPDPSNIKKAAKMLLDAKAPVIIAGGGVHMAKAYAELKAFAELLGISVATSYSGKSAFAEVHPLAVGMMGMFGQKVANEVIGKADVLLVAGCCLSPSDIKNENPNLIDPAKQKIIQIDIDPRNAGWVFPVDLTLISDLKVVLSQLAVAVKKLSGGKLPIAKKRLDALKKIKTAADAFEAPELYSDAQPILPQRIVKEIEKAVDEDTLITLDAGNNRLWLAHFFKSKAAGTMLCPGGVAGMGWGPPAAIGVKFLNPDKNVLSVSGDGGFGMVLNVLSTAVQYKLPIVFLVINNSVLGMVYDTQRGRNVASEFVETDFAAVARAFKCNGVRVEKPADLAPAIKKAFKASVPTLIDVVTSTSEPFFKIAN